MESFNSYPSVVEHHGKKKCMFGPTLHNDTKSRFFPIFQCGHIDHEDMSRSYLRATNFSKDYSNVRHFAIVREPFDRLRSLFDYLVANEKIELWKESNTDAQYERVRAKDFAGWLDLVIERNDVPHRKQYVYIDDDVDKAISKIAGNSPNVTVLVNECFEASLTLLASKVQVKDSAVDDFLVSKRKKANTSAGYNHTDAAMLRELHERTKVAFVDEYRFYDAAVEQFKKHLGFLNSSLLQGCELE